MDRIGRLYHQHCGLARALDVVGQRWTLLIVRDLLLGPRRFGDLLQGLPGITTNLLSKRLQELLALGLIEKRTLPSPARADVYALTHAGQALETPISELARWGGRYMHHVPRGDVMNLGWALLSLKRRYAGGHDVVVEFVCGERHFELGFGPERLQVAEKSSERAVARAEASQDAFFDLLFRGATARELESRGALRVEGDRRRFEEAISALVLPAMEVLPEEAASARGVSRRRRSKRPSRTAG